MMYSGKILVSETLCHFFGAPCTINQLINQTKHIYTAPSFTYDSELHRL